MSEFRFRMDHFESVVWRRKLKIVKHSCANQRVIVTRSSKINNCHVIFNSCAKRNCLRIYFSSKNPKVNLGGTHDLNDREKYGSKQEKVIGVMASTMISKNDFWNKEAVGRKSPKSRQKSKKMPKKRSFWQFGTKSQGYTNFYFGFKNWNFQKMNFLCKAISLAKLFRKSRQHHRICNTAWV